MSALTTGRLAGAPSALLPLALLLSLSGSTGTAQAMTYHVGRDRTFKTVASTLPHLRPGDVVEIDPGVYHEVDRISVNGAPGSPITFRAASSGRPMFDAEGLDTSGRGAIPRGVFQIEGAYIVLDGLEFKNARNGMNAAGIRLADSTNAIIRNCRVSQCDMGIFGGDKETALVEDCEVFENGTPSFNGGSHNFYMHGNRVVVRRCFIHDSLYGQNYKSRAHYNELWYNWIVDSNEGEVGCVDGAGETDRPNSNVLMVGNTIRSKVDRTGNQAKFVLMGSELGGSHHGMLYLYGNTFIAATPRIQFINLDDPFTSASIAENSFYGSDQLITLNRSTGRVDARHNLLPRGVRLPAGWSDQPATAVEYLDGDGHIHILPWPPASSAILGHAHPEDKSGR